jgi:serine/threonine-protein kinase
MALAPVERLNSPGPMDTILPREPSEYPGRPSGFGLPPDLLEKARGRLQFFTLLMVAAYGVSLATMLALSAKRGLPLGPGMVGDTSGLVLSIAMYFAARSRSITHTRALVLGLVYEVAICLILSVFYTWHVYYYFGFVPMITWTCILIALYPLIVPCPPSRALWTSIAAAATAPLGYGLIVWRVGAELPLEGWALSMGPVLFSVVLAYLASRAFYGMSIDVAHAREMGSYRLEEQLGKGGMGVVWRARHRLLARPAAIKVVSRDILSNLDAETGAVVLQRFKREAQVTANLRSPHTVQLYDFGVTDEGTFYYVMELLEGLDVETMIEKHGPIEPERAAHFMLHACESLEEAHDYGLVHRDIKPGNLFACRLGLRDDFVKVLDFGLVALQPARAAETAKLSMDGTAMGTPHYMAPEVSTGQTADPRTDLYSLGGVIYWLLTGRTLFQGDTPIAVALAHINQRPKPPSEIVTVPREFEEIVMACLERESENRPRSAGKLAASVRATGLAERWTAERAREWWEGRERE